MLDNRLKFMSVGCTIGIFLGALVVTLIPSTTKFIMAAYLILTVFGVWGLRDDFRDIFK